MHAVRRPLLHTRLCPCAPQAGSLVLWRITMTAAEIVTDCRNSEVFSFSCSIFETDVIGYNYINFKEI